MLGVSPDSSTALNECFNGASLKYTPKRLRRLGHKTYNTTIRRFPTNILAGMFGFDAKAYFEAEIGAEKAPTVEF